MQVKTWQKPLIETVISLKKHAFDKKTIWFGTDGYPSSEVPVIRPIDLRLGYYATRVASVYQELMKKDSIKGKGEGTFSDYKLFMELLELSVNIECPNPHDANLVRMYNAIKEMMSLIKERFHAKPDDLEESTKRIIDIVSKKKKI